MSGDGLMAEVSQNIRDWAAQRAYSDGEKAGAERLATAIEALLDEYDRLDAYVPVGDIRDILARAIGGRT